MRLTAAVHSRLSPSDARPCVDMPCRLTGENSVFRLKDFISMRHRDLRTLFRKVSAETPVGCGADVTNAEATRKATLTGDTTMPETVTEIVYVDLPEVTMTEAEYAELYPNG